jgi:hypothetical protein
MCSTQAPRLRGSDEAIISYWLGDESLGCLYGTKDTSLIATRLTRDKTGRKDNIGRVECSWKVGRE